MKRFFSNAWYVFCYPVLFFVIFHGLGKVEFELGLPYIIELVKVMGLDGMGMVQIMIWLIAVAGIPLFMRKQGPFRELYSFRRIEGTTLILLAVFAISLCLLVSTSVSWLTLFNLYPDGSEYLWFSKIAIRHVTFLIPILLFAPLFEEVIFRGILLKRLLKVTRRPWVALIIQAICFSLTHIILFQLPYTFVMGLFFGLVFLWTRSLWASILVHFINNLISVISLYCVEDFTESDSSSLLWVIAASLIVSGLLLFLLYRRRIQIEPDEMEA